MILCESFSAGGSGMFLQGRHVLAFHIILTLCVRSQPSLCPAAVIPDCLALQNSWGELLSALSNESNVKHTVCSKISLFWLNTQAGFCVFIQWFVCVFVKAGIDVYVNVFSVVFLCLCALVWVQRLQCGCLCVLCIFVTLREKLGSAKFLRFSFNSTTDSEP